MRPAAAIAELPEVVAALSAAGRDRIERLYAISRAVGETNPPPELHAWLADQFGSLDAVRRQRVIQVTNRATGDATLFSELRARRPLQAPLGDGLAAIIEGTRGDAFCHPDTGTPADPFGRVRGKRMLSGANAAKFEANHAVLIFDEHDPTAFDAETVVDLLATGRAWAERAHASDPRAIYYLLMWNSLWRAGGSIVHGHAQVLMGRDRHYGRIERFRQDALAWRARHGTSLVGEIVAAHRDLGLAFELDGVTVLALVTPIKERELWIVGTAGDEREPRFAEATAATVIAYRDRLGVRAFNLALMRPPIEAPANRSEDWSDLPPIVRLVDRGDPGSRASDIGAMELFAASVVGSDPYSVIRELRTALG